ncbi:MAG TPA: DNA-3-methyladenine glycosylase 2 family protein [Candidatus Limnocylindria bacterium]|nr:DNA-3-methyladenine glycosylase 2 family protein [Candidatus Limnocylindria bacterium]
MITSVPLDERALARAVRTLARAEPRFASIVERHGPPPLWPREPGFETLVLLMLEQQVSLAQARAMYARVVTATGTVTPANVAKLGEPGLRALGVTRQKSAYLAALASQLERKQLDLDALATLTDADAFAALDALHGVGPWTAQCYLLFALRRADAFPAADLALMEAVRQLWRLRARPSPEALARRAQAWSPHRAVAARLLWHHYLSERGSRDARASP